MASIKIKINTQRITKKGYPVVFQVIHKRQKRLIYTNYYLLKSEFNEKKGIAVSKSRSIRKLNEVKEINDYIANEYRFLCSIIERLELIHKEFCIDDIVNLYAMHESDLYLETFTAGLIAKLRHAGSNGTANAYQSTLNKLNMFFCAKPILITDITSNTVRDFTDYLKTENIKENTINFYMRIFRAIYNYALKEHVITVNREPFRDMIMHAVKTNKKAISKSLIKDIAELDLSNNAALELTRDIFLFSFFSRGMPFVDCAFLKYSDISHQNIVYLRQKTKQKLEIKIEVQLYKIIEKYRRDSDYILPILNPKLDKPLYNQYRNALRSHNKRLKKISRLMNLECELSTYVARHSWATIAKYQGIPLSVISEGLGHTSERTTYTYLASLDPSVLNNANEKVILL